MKIGAAHIRGQKRLGAFTLIEVILAVAIITGLLAVALYFYQQAASLRTELLQETERISAARLLMDKITTELRCARRHSYFQVPLTGEGSSIQFITATFPTRSVWSGESYGRVTRPESDLKYVSYRLASSEGDTNVGGLNRSEEPLVEFRKAATPGFDSTVATNRASGILVTDQLRFLQFRYWDGSAWQDSWNETRLPAAVEVTLAAEPPIETFEEELPLADDESVFRRVIYLPGSAAPAPQGNRSSTNSVEFMEEEVL